METVASAIGVEVVLSVTCPLSENVGAAVDVEVGVGVRMGDGAKKHPDCDVHADATIMSRRMQPRLNMGINAPTWKSYGWLCLASVVGIERARAVPRR